MCWDAATVLLNLESTDSQSALSSPVMQKPNVNEHLSKWQESNFQVSLDNLVDLKVTFQPYNLNLECARSR